MIGAFVLVAIQSFRNRTMSQLRRLRNPRYLVGALAGAAYFYMVFLRRSHAAHRGFDGIAQAGFADMRVGVMSVALLLLALLAWALPSDSGGVEFTEAEIAFLFPAPLTRAQLLLYKGLRAQPQVLFTSLIVSFFAFPASHLLGVWALFTTASIYTMMVTQGRARLRLAGVNLIVRMLVVALIVSAIVMYGVYEVRHSFNPELLHKGTGAVRSAASAFFDRPGIAALIFVPRMFVNTMYPPTQLVFFESLAAVALFGFLSALLASRFVVSFEEASIVASKRRLDRLQLRGAQRSGRHIMFRRMRAPFLAPTGLPDFAIVWKNVVALLRMSSGWAFAMLIMLVAQYSVALTMNDPSVYAGIGMVLAMITALFPLLGPNAFANDLRLDLSRFEVLKSYPISGERLVAAEIAAPLVVISFFELLFISSATLMLSLGKSIDVRMTFFTNIRFVIIALLVTIPICAVQLVLRNAVPIFFPAWSGRSKEDPRGISVTGQRLVMLAGNVFALALALIPAAVVFLPSLWVAMRWFSGHPVSIAIATMPAVATLIAEVWLAIRFLGDRFDELDVSNEIEIAEFA